MHQSIFIPELKELLDLFLRFSVKVRNWVGLRAQRRLPADRRRERHRRFIPASRKDQKKSE